MPAPREPLQTMGSDGSDSDGASVPNASGTDRAASAGSILTRWGARGTALVLGLGALVMVLIGATLGLALAGNGPQPASISAEGKDPVDTGFARDMVVHHTQGVLMAHVAELNSDSKEIRLMAYDIEYTQTSQIGSMMGWLDLWGVPRLTGEAPMQWMGSKGMAAMNMGGAATASAVAAGTPLMPGMATDAEVSKLQGLNGAASDTYFLQLMIRHHQGGAAMMKYAANHAASPVVQNFASKMLESQDSEIGVMTGMLAERGAKPLAFPAPTG